MIKISNRDLKGIYIGNEKITDSFKFNNMIWKAPRTVKSGEPIRLNYEWLRPFEEDNYLYWSFEIDPYDENTIKLISEKLRISIKITTLYINYAFISLNFNNRQFIVKIRNYNDALDNQLFFSNFNLGKDITIKNERYWKSKE